MVRVLEGIRSGGNPPCQGSNNYFYLVLLEEGWARIRNMSARPALPSAGIRQGRFPNMPRISEIEDEGDDLILSSIFTYQRENYGGVLNPTKVLAHRPGILKAAIGLYAAC